MTQEKERKEKKEKWYVLGPYHVERVESKPTLNRNRDRESRAKGVYK